MAFNLNVIPEIMNSLAPREDGETLAAAYRPNEILWHNGNLYYCSQFPNGLPVGTDIQASINNGTLREFVAGNFMLNARTFSDVYVPGRTYEFGETVVHNGNIYLAVNAAGGFRPFTSTDASPDTTLPAVKWMSVSIADIMNRKTYIHDIAHEFDDSATYETGDLVVKIGSVLKPNGSNLASAEFHTLFMAKKHVTPSSSPRPGDITTPGSFETENWKPVSLCDVLKSKATALDLAAEFNAGTAYDAGSLVLHNGRLYKANEDHAAGVDWDDAKWSETNIAANLGGSISWAIVGDEFSSSTPYSKDDYVIKDNKLYRAKADLAAHEWVGSEWEETNVVKNLAKGNFLNQVAEADAYDTAETYAIGDLCTYNGDIYKANKVTGGSTFIPADWNKFKPAVEVNTKAERNDVAKPYAPGSDYTEGDLVYVHDYTNNKELLVVANKDITNAPDVWVGADWDITDIDTCLKAGNFRAAFNLAMASLGTLLGFEHHYEKRDTDVVKKDYFDFINI